MKKQILILILTCGIAPYTLAQEVPDTAYLKRVSVDPLSLSGHTWIYWEPSPSPEVDGYYIYVWDYDQNGAIVIGIVGANTTQFERKTVHGNYMKQSYVVSAFDSDPVDTIWSPLTEKHTTIYTISHFDPCNASFLIEWNPYEGWGDSLKNYSIWRSKNGSIFSKTDSTLPSDTMWIDTDIEAYSKYCYYIEATNLDARISTSNMTCDSSNMPRIPDYINANGTVFVDNQTVNVSFTIDPFSELDKYYLIRGENSTGVFDTIRIIIVPGGGNITITDTIPEEKPYYYQLVSMNDCGNIVKRSNLTSTLWLTVTNSGFINNLNWNAYINWPGGVDRYEVYRTAGDDPPELIQTIDSTTTTISDDITNLIYTTSPGEFCYYVVAEEGEGSPYGPGTSRSNTACVHPESIIYMPNAFTPDGDGLNEEFIPILTFTPNEYLFIIRSRWGNTIFQTKNHLEPWDGKFSGTNIQAGVYIYYVRAVNQEGQLLEQRGQVMVIYPAK